MIPLSMIPTIVTPFQQDGSFDWAGLEALIELYRGIGCEGVFGVCQSSEMFSLSDEQKLELAEKTLAFCRARGLKCVLSGHTQDSFEDQIAYLQALEALRPDAVILVSNRLARAEEDDAAALRGLERLCGALKKDTPLGIYECPYPYKRLLTPALMDAMIADGRFAFIKDTCCEIDRIKARLERLRGSGIRLYNANMATFKESMALGAAGYSGVMLNLLPECFGLLKQAYDAGDETRVRLMCETLTCASTVECQNYPANAKYCLAARGMIASDKTLRQGAALTESQRRELDAFMACTRRAFTALTPHVPRQLLARYDTAFPECHASTVLPLQGGRVLVAYFAGSYERADDVGIWLSVRDDECWRAPRLVAKAAAVAHWNPVLYETAQGIRLVFKVGESIWTWRTYTMLSTDGGERWTRPEPLGAPNPAGGPVRSKPITLMDGRVLAPNSDESAEGWFPRVDLSADGGHTFVKLADIPIERGDAASPNCIPGLGAIQPTLWESERGHVHAFLRTTGGRIYRSDSQDGGAHWCVAYPTALPNNNSGIDIAQWDGALYLAMNPVSGAQGARTPLALLRSEDGGDTFSTMAILADEWMDDVHGCEGQFCYPAIAVRDGVLYISFTEQRKSIAFCQIDLNAWPRARAQ